MALYSIRGYFYSLEELEQMQEDVKRHEHAELDRATHDDHQYSFHIHFDDYQIES